MPAEAAARGAPRLSFVVPCYNEEAALPALLAALSGLSATLVAAGRIDGPPEIVLVDDGSRDGTWDAILAARATHPVTAVRLSRNHGHQKALLAGLMTAEGSAVVSLDADLQDDPAAIPRMLEAYAAGAEIVYGVRARRDRDTGFKRGTARLYYRLLSALGVDILEDHADFRLMSRKAIEILRRYEESNLFLRGLVRQIGLPSAVVTYDRGAREAGETKYTLGKMIALAVEGVTSFTNRPLRFVAWAGFAIAFAAFGYAVFSVVAWALGLTLPGWTTIVVPIYFLGGVQLIAIGILGEYVGKIYLETKRRPQFILDQVLRRER